MTPQQLLSILHHAERLKDITRHAYTSGGRRESVAEHCWRLCLTAYFLRHDFPDVDMDKVICMGLIHDLGEVFTGDIPTFLKTDADAAQEEQLLSRWVSALPAPYDVEMASLYAEMHALQTPEAKLWQALDKLEAVIQHNESPIDTWEYHEYQLNRTYATDTVAYSEYLTALRTTIRAETEEKIKRESIL